MDCETVERENIAERYLAGSLDPQLKEEWEQHYFGCDRCAEQLATWQAIEKPLRAMAPAIRQEMRPRPASRSWLWAVGAAAALLVGVGITLTRPANRPAIRPADRGAALPATSQTTAPVAAWAEMARLEPPAYQPPTLRSAGSPAEVQFQKAMESYMRGDYQNAVPGLNAALQLDPNSAAPRFFLGACDLLTGKAADGERALARVAAGDSPFAPEAQFDLAKAYLMQGQKDSAVGTLRKLADAGGEFREPATQLLARIAATQ